MLRLFILLPLAMMTTCALASTEDELLDAVHAETRAFADGDCESLMASMARELTFYANGRRMQREQVRRFCETIPRPFGQGRDPIEDETRAYAISDTAGYTVREFRWLDAKGATVHEVVTKIWRRQEGRWVITHFQSTVNAEKAGD